MARIRLVYLAHGDTSFLDETWMSVLTAKGHATRRGDDVSFQVFTDAPDHFSGFDVEIHPVDRAQLQAWSAPTGAPFKDKIHCLRLGMADFDGICAYVDTDTWFLRSPGEIADRVSLEQSVMHQPEYPFTDPEWAEARGRIDGAFPGRMAIVDEEAYVLESPVAMWNAGVIALHPEKSALLDHVLALTDMVYTGTELRLSEQLSVTNVLHRHGRLGRCDDVLEHYWDRWPDPYRDGVSLREWRHGEISRFREANRGLAFEELALAAASFKPAPFKLSTLERVAHAVRKRLGAVVRR